MSKAASLWARLCLCFFAVAASSFGESHSLTLPQALELAARQNPDVTLARLDQQRSEQGILVAQDPFRPKVTLGSGAAYTYGYPNSIQGSAPSIFQVTTQQSLFNKPKSYQLAAAREFARATEYGAQAKTDEIAYQVADLFLTASQVENAGKVISTQLPSLQKVLDTTSAAVTEGSQLPLELKRARLNLASSQEQLGAAEYDSDYYEMMLAVVVGYPAADRVKPVESDLPATLSPVSENDAVDVALRNNRQLRHMQSNILAKQLDLRSYRSARLPQVDLVAQYALFARYNYDQYFSSSAFRRHNFQLGAAISLPLLIGSSPKGFMQQALTDMQKLRIQTDQLRNRILTDTRRSYEQWKKAENIRNLARLRLEVAREDLTVKLAQNGEGRVPMQDLEQARLDESSFWMQLYDSETQVTRAKLSIFRQMGTLMAAIQAGGAAQETRAARP